MKETFTDPGFIREHAHELNAVENRVSKRQRRHSFKKGDRAELVGLESFPEFNGQQVTITNVRDDGPHGTAYYIKGAINRYLNWVYEYRLKAIADQ